uniref:Uncharacterized protein n=1 Tax=Setaria viridis TaxID=4556 RepID=A0A4U6TFP8_SETVI|nr:hypothetical protein SEVIR_8G155950v2 [Setaria viridis]
MGSPSMKNGGIDGNFSSNWSRWAASGLHTGGGARSIKLQAAVAAASHEGWASSVTRHAESGAKASSRLVSAILAPVTCA